MQLLQPALMDSQVWRIGEKVFKSKQRPLPHTDRRQHSGEDACNPKMGSADQQSYPGIELQEGRLEWKLRKLEQRRTISVKGRRHILSVLKPVEERVKVEGEESFKLERKALSVKEPASWSWGDRGAKNWQVAHGQDHLSSTTVRTKNPIGQHGQGAARQLERSGWMEMPGKILFFTCQRGGGKGQSSRERGMNRAAMDERNMRERFWRLRERASVIKLNDLLPEDKKSEKVGNSTCWGQMYYGGLAIQVCLGAVLKGAHQFSLELLDQEQKVAWPFRGCRDHSERQNRLATFGHFFSWSLGL